MRTSGPLLIRTAHSWRLHSHYAKHYRSVVGGDRTAFRITPKGISGREMECTLSGASFFAISSRH